MNHGIIARDFIEAHYRDVWKGSVTDDYRVGLHAVSVGLRSRCFLLSLRYVSLHRLFRDGSTTCGVSFHLYVESLKLTSRSPDLQIWLMTNDINMIQYRLLVSLEELSLLSVFGLYAFKRYRYQLLKFTKISLSVTLSTLVRGRAESASTSTFCDPQIEDSRPCILRDRLNKCVLELNQKSVVRFKIYEDVRERLWLEVRHPIYGSLRIISQDVTWICINYQDFIIIDMSEVFISSELSSVRLAIRIFCRSNDIFTICAPGFHVMGKLQSVLDAFFDTSSLKKQRLKQIRWDQIVTSVLVDDLYRSVRRHWCAVESICVIGGICQIVNRPILPTCRDDFLELRDEIHYKTDSCGLVLVTESCLLRSAIVLWHTSIFFKDEVGVVVRMTIISFSIKIESDVRMTTLSLTQKLRPTSNWRWLPSWSTNPT